MMHSGYNTDNNFTDNYYGVNTYLGNSMNTMMEDANAPEKNEDYYNAVKTEEDVSIHETSDLGSSINTTLEENNDSSAVPLFPPSLAVASDFGECGQSF